VLLSCGRYSHSVSPATDTREHILQAAEGLVLRLGVARLTIQGAADEAGVSKGGVLYHFPTRDALVSAMVERLACKWEDDLARHKRTSGDVAPGAFTRAYVASTVSPYADDRQARLGAAVIAGVAANPDLLAPLRERFTEWQRAVEHDGIRSELATVIRLASDGLWLIELFDLAPLSPTLRNRVSEELIRLANLPEAVELASPNPEVGAERAADESSSRRDARDAHTG
jgi:AcrR family transcriptional regulator